VEAAKEHSVVWVQAKVVRVREDGDLLLQLTDRAGFPVIMVLRPEQVRREDQP
jgi:hypothetical protein